MICYYRPHLTKELLRESLRMILWSLGAGIDYSILKQFIDKRILMKDVEPYGGLPGNEGIEWLTNVGTNEIILIKNTLEEVIKQNDIELEELKNRHN